MKKIYWIFLLMLIVFSACKKSTDENDNNNTGWTAEDQIFYENMLALQDNASEKYDSWSQSMDSLEAIVKLQQFFLSDPSVTSATIGEQGIAVEYSNGMRGGIFLNPKDDPIDDSFNANLPQELRNSTLSEKSLVNNKTAILINPSYWERYPYTNSIEDNYNLWLPKVGFSLKYVLRNTAAKINRFTQLSGYGLIHIYSHGWAWPKEYNIEDVYLLTGERTSDSTTKKYETDIKNKNIIIAKARISNTQKSNVYFINQNFIANHNDFSKDTVLFYGGFCYSFLGKWDQLYQKFARGSYYGFTWSVLTDKNAGWAVSLVDSLCDTTSRPPYNPEKWITGSNPPKSYWYEKAKKTVSIQYVGDATLTLWKDSATIVTNPITNITPTTATSGGIIKSDGGSPVKDRGVVWSTTANPTINDFGTWDGSGTGSYISEITGLRANTTYYVRAYATNSAGTMYGNQVSFKTTSKTYSSILWLDINVAVSWKWYDSGNNLINSGEGHHNVMLGGDVPCIQTGNTLTASFPSPCSGSITITLNPDHSLLSYTFDYRCEDNYGVKTFNCTVTNVPYIGDTGGEDLFLANETYPLIQSFDARYNYTNGDYITYELIRNTQYDNGTMVELGYTK